MSRSMRMGGWLFGTVTTIFVVGLSFGRAAPPDSVYAEYERRVAQLKPDDIAGHFKLATWCKERGAWELVRKECTLILAQDGGHEQAKLLQELAMRRLGESKAGPKRPGESKPGVRNEEIGKLGRIISDAEVRRIRWMEMLDDEPRPLSIKFKNKVIQRFLDAMEGTAGFTTRNERGAFMKLKPTAKLQLIRKHTGDRYFDDIVIKTDPKRLADFERRVLPVALRGCATSHCHGDPKASRFTLYTDRVMSKNMAYTNYLIMHDYRVGGKRVINRDDPERSLLLTYGLRELLAGTDPTYKHPGEVKPVFRGANDPKYRAIREWLESLSTLEPDYGISLEPSGSNH